MWYIVFKHVKRNHSTLMITASAESRRALELRLIDIDDEDIDILPPLNEKQIKGVVRQLIGGQ